MRVLSGGGGGPTGGMLGRAGGLGPRVSGLTRWRSLGVCGEGPAWGGRKTPWGLGRVLGPFLSWGGGLPGAEGSRWVEEGSWAGGLGEELSSLLLKEVERRTLDWASFSESR